MRAGASPQSAGDLPPNPWGKELAHTRDPNPTKLDPNDPKAKQTHIPASESFAEYMARRNGQKHEAPSAPVGATQAVPAPSQSGPSPAAGKIDYGRPAYEPNTGSGPEHAYSSSAAVPAQSAAAPMGAAPAGNGARMVEYGRPGYDPRRRAEVPRAEVPHAVLNAPLAAAPTLYAPPVAAPVVPAQYGGGFDAGPRSGSKTSLQAAASAGVSDTRKLSYGRGGYDPTAPRPNTDSLFRQTTTLDRAAAPEAPAMTPSAAPAQAVPAPPKAAPAVSARKEKKSGKLLTVFAGAVAIVKGFFAGMIPRRKIDYGRTAYDPKKRSRKTKVTASTPYADQLNAQGKGHKLDARRGLFRAKPKSAPSAKVTTPVAATPVAVMPEPASAAAPAPQAAPAPAFSSVPAPPERKVVYGRGGYDPKAPRPKTDTLFRTTKVSYGRNGYDPKASRPKTDTLFRQTITFDRAAAPEAPAMAPAAAPVQAAPVEAVAAPRQVSYGRNGYDPKASRPATDTLYRTTITLDRSASPAPAAVERAPAPPSQEDKKRFSFRSLKLSDFFTLPI